jgi:Cu2+-exporting ATPase
MVGDGINDTAALAAADVGMAMAGGVDAASDVSKVVLMGDQLHQVADAIELSRKTLAKIQQNLGWAFCYNIVGIPLAAGVLLPKYGLALTPSISGALMGVSSLAVMANSLMLQLEVKGMRNGLQTAVAAAARPGEAAAAAVAAAHNGAANGGGKQQRDTQQQQGGSSSSSSRGMGLQLAAAEAASAAE